jgi:hypothetical protein
VGLITKRLKETFKAPDEALFFGTLKFPPRLLVLSLCGNNQDFFFRGEVGSPALYGSLKTVGFARQLGPGFLKSRLMSKPQGSSIGVYREFS